MKNLLALIALITGICHPERTHAQSLDLGGTTRAVVVGISDYQDNAIPDLRFADRDAEAFAASGRLARQEAISGDYFNICSKPANMPNKDASFPVHSNPYLRKFIFFIKNIET